MHERDTSHGAGVAKVLIGAGQGMPAIADIVLKHALFQQAYEQLAGGAGKKGALCHRTEQRPVCEAEGNADPTSISCRCFFRHTDNAHLQGFSPCEENGI